MGFTLFIVYLGLIYLRPGEQVAALQGWPVMDVASGLALGAAALNIMVGRGPSFRGAQTPLLLALLVWALLSVVASPGRSAAALEDVLGLAKSSGTAFLLVILNVVTPRRLRAVAVALTVVAVLVVGQAIAAYHLGIGATQFLVQTAGPQASEPESEGWSTPPDLEDTDSEVVGDSRRIRGLGPIGDPNDLACALVSILPLSLALRHNGSYLRNALLVWLPVGAIVYGVYLTRSRGGILALAAVLALSLSHRIGRTLSILAGAVAVMIFLALGFLGGRSMSIDASAAGRIDAWSTGLQMLKSSPVWGVGFGMFGQYNVLTAHNSFVLCFAELGLVGYFLWLSLIMITADDLRYVIRDQDKSIAELRAWARALTASLVGFLTGGIFLSRSYDVTLFILIGLGAAVANLARRAGHVPRTRSVLAWIYLVVGVEIASLALFWLYMRLLR
jgi:hypothetical protein